MLTIRVLNRGASTAPLPNMSPDNTHKRLSSGGARKTNSKGLKSNADPPKKKGVLKNAKSSYQRDESEDDTMASFPQFW